MTASISVTLCSLPPATSPSQQIAELRQDVGRFWHLYLAFAVKAYTVPLQVSHNPTYTSREVTNILNRSLHPVPKHQDLLYAHNLNAIIPDCINFGRHTAVARRVLRRGEQSNNKSVQAILDDPKALAENLTANVQRAEWVLEELIAAKNLMLARGELTTVVTPDGTFTSHSASKLEQNFVSWANTSRRAVEAMAGPKLPTVYVLREPVVQVPDPALLGDGTS